ncbi:MAG: trypsin-like peptidase domain-containing protein [Betaproteobacteria bacterium]|nr:trypsin-like peptidase domain-containing protein [Betaproteobacteria bacterium]
MVQLARPSVQSLLIQTQADGRPIATASGFLVQSRFGPLLITNRHVLTGRDQNTQQVFAPNGDTPTEVIIIHNRKDAVGQWLARVEPLYDGPVKRWFEHPVLGAKMDVAALRLTALNDVETYPFDLADPGTDMLLGPGDAVSVVGFPFGQTAGGNMLPVWATAFLASEPVQNFADLPIQLVDCRTLAGQSGAPVIAYRSSGDVAMNDGGVARFDGPVLRFLGVYGGRVTAAADLGVVWKAAALKELVDAL